MQLNASPLTAPRVLCHPDGKKSCGACCGMYNHTATSRAETTTRLTQRSAAFRADAAIDDAGSLAAFRAEWEPTPASRLLPRLPTCPFLGFVDADEPRRVGCLVHPLQNGGTDGRDAGVYDRFICEDYLCAAHQILTTAEKWLVIAATVDSYTYGLVVTDPLFVRQLFERSADINAASPTARGLQRPKAIDAARAYFTLKVDWPWSAPDGIFGQLRAGEGLETPRRKGPSEQLGVEPDAWETILRCLGTDARSKNELIAARSVIDSAVRQFANAVAI